MKPENLFPVNKIEKWIKAERGRADRIEKRTARELRVLRAEIEQNAEVLKAIKHHVGRLDMMLAEPGKYCLAVTADGLIVYERQAAKRKELKDGKIT